ncbi:MAG: dipeptidase [marine bacterium B5-7]|nr:MAG: dipeptidase [marine bacterium B5-7]
MNIECQQRIEALRALLSDHDYDAALITDESSMVYFTGVSGYLGMDFGRPTSLLIHTDDDPVIITPALESEMVGEMTNIADIRTFEDAGNNTWQTVLGAALDDLGGARLGIEARQIPVVVRDFLEGFAFTGNNLDLGSVSEMIGGLRMIKSSHEIEIMRQAGTIAAAMMRAAEASLAAGAAEYESALAIINEGTRTAAKYLDDENVDRFVSPMIHNLQIMQSGRDTSMVHRRAGVKRYESGDPVYFCFCQMAEFRHYKLGFDRMFFIDHISDDAARVQQAAIDAQQAAIAAIRPGIVAEDVALAADAVYAQRGYATGYRTGRAIGLAYLEAPELKAGDTTELKVGMTFAVDGGISVDGVLGGRIGDSVVVTDEGFEYLTDYPREIRVV